MSCDPGALSKFCRLGLLLLLGAACDDAPRSTPADAGLPADACAEVVLARPPWSLHRCTDGLGYSLRHDEAPIFERPGFGIWLGAADAPVRVDPSDHPEVAWRVVDDAVIIRAYGRSDLPALALEIHLGPTPALRLTAEGIGAPLRVDRLEPLALTAEGTAGRAGLHWGWIQTDAGVLAGTAVEFEGLPIRWSAPLVASAPVGATLPPGGAVRSARLALAWHPSSPYPALDSTRPWIADQRRAQLGWGYAIAETVDAEALAAVDRLRAALRPHGVTAPPAVLLRGAWPDAEQVAGLGDALVGARVPIDSDLSVPADRAAASQTLVDLAAIGVGWLLLAAPEATPAAIEETIAPFAGPALLEGPTAPGAGDGLLLGERPPADTAAALAGWGHLDGRLTRVFVAPIDLGRPLGELRALSTLAAIAGGAPLLSGSPDSPEAVEIAARALTAAGLEGARPTSTGLSIWEGPGAYVVFNWEAIAVSVSLPARPDLEGAPRLFASAPPFHEGEAVTVPPLDVAAFTTPAVDAVGGVE